MCQRRPDGRQYPGNALIGAGSERAACCCTSGARDAKRDRRRSSQAAKGESVAIFAQDKENAIAVGVLMMSTAEIRSVNSGHGVENLHFLTDGLWNTKRVG